MIHDKFTKLKAEVSRQRIHQLRRLEKDLCRCCDGKVFKSELCRKHYKEQTRIQFERQRNRLGIPLDWPKGKHFNKKGGKK